MASGGGRNGNVLGLYSNFSARDDVRGEAGRELRPYASTPTIAKEITFRRKIAVVGLIATQQ